MTWDYKLSPEQADLPATRQELINLWQAHHDLSHKYSALVEILESFTGKSFKDRVALKQRLQEAENAEAQAAFDGVGGDS
jgi:hypothetical protein